MTTDQPPTHYRNGGGAAVLIQGQQHLLRNLVGEDADDGVLGYVTEADVGQTGEAALAELLKACQP